jgi:hypothetical protein
MSDNKKPTELSPQQAAGIQNSGGTNLPEAGYKRVEEIARRKDNLAQEAEELARQRQVFALRKDAFNEERELQDMIQTDQRSGAEDYLVGENLDYDHFGYRLIQCMYPRDTPGMWFTTAKSEGFEPVTTQTLNLDNGRPVVSSNGRYRGNIDFDDAVQIGDCVLMQMERFRYETWLRAREARNQRVNSARQGYNVSPAPGTIIHDDPSDPIVQRLSSAQGGDVVMMPSETAARQTLAKSLAIQQLGEQIRTGTVGAQLRR